MLGVSAVIASWYYVGELSLGLLLFSAYLFAPWAMLAYGAGSLAPLARGVAVALIAAMTIAMYASIWTDDSSTAALGFLWLPVYQWLAIGAVIAFQRVRRDDVAA